MWCLSCRHCIANAVPSLDDMIHCLNDFLRCSWHDGSYHVWDIVVLSDDDRVAADNDFYI